MIGAEYTTLFRRNQAHQTPTPQVPTHRNQAHAAVRGVSSTHHASSSSKENPSSVIRFEDLPAPTFPSVPGVTRAASGPGIGTQMAVTENPVKPRPAEEVSSFGYWVGLVIVVVALGCGSYWTWHATKAWWSTLCRVAPRRVAWACRTSRVPAISAAMLVAFIVSFFTFRWILTRGEAPASQVPVQAHHERTIPTGKAFVRWAVGVLMQQEHLRRDQAEHFTALLVNESGWGAGVHGNNIGNIKGKGPVAFTDRAGFYATYLAYDSPEAGLHAALSLVRDCPRYRTAWKLLMQGDPLWYSELGVRGYFEGPVDRTDPARPRHTVHTVRSVQRAQADYDSILARVRRYSTEDAEVGS